MFKLFRHSECFVSVMLKLILTRRCWGPIFWKDRSLGTVAKGGDVIPISDRSPIFSDKRRDPGNTLESEE